MTEPVADLHGILERLEVLEKQNRRLRRGWLLVPVLVALGVFVRSEAQQQGRSVQAEEFVVIDSANKPRAALASRSDGSVGLGLTDKDGKKVAALDVTAAGITLAMGGDEAKARAVIEVLADGAARITLADASKKPRCTMGLGANGDTVITLSDGAGTTRLALVQQHAADASPLITFLDAAGKPTVVVPKPKTETPPKK